MQPSQPQIQPWMDSPRFLAVCESLLRSGLSVRFRAEGRSMEPNLLTGDILTVEPVSLPEVHTGEIVLFRNAEGLKAHRAVSVKSAEGILITRGDTGLENDLPATEILGRVTEVERGNRSISLQSRGTQTQHAVRSGLRKIRLAAAARLRRIHLLNSSLALTIGFLAFFGVAGTSRAQADLTITQTASVSTVPVGTNYTYTETATNNGPNSVPANTLVIYQQTPANTIFRGITANNWTCTTPAVGSAGPVYCTYNLALASGANTSANPITITVRVVNGTASGTTIQNSATVTSQTVDPVPTNNTSITTILVEPTGDADLSVSMTALPTPVFVNSSLTYTAVVKNQGPASATGVTLTDTIPTGTTFASATPSVGTCTGTTSISCSLGTIAANASATVTIVVTTPSTATSLSNTVQATTTATDPTSSDDSATVITVVQPLVCATPGRDGAGGALTGVVNAYYPPSAAVVLNSGSTTVTLGAAAASGAQKAIASGDLLLFIQMQDAAINSTNTSSYGDGTPGDPANGSTSLNSSGDYEFVTATNAVPVTGGTLTFQGTGPSAGLLNTYTEAAYNAGVQGKRVFQVIRVPQYTSATLSSTLQAMPWNGATGGVLALDVSSQLTLGGTVALDGAGFRGGGGRLLAGTGTGTDTDYLTLSTNPANGSKGEGIAGTPEFLTPATITTTTTATDTGVEGLPNGSYARGAPGNAGGGGTDGDPSGDSENSGGGAGGNGGTGGLGGYGWNSFTALNSTNGGFGGTAFPASTSALVMGGGGGAGTTNNGSYYISATNHDSNSIDAACTNVTCTGIYSSGGAGGGIAIVHTGSVAGTGTITSNGQSTLSTDNDSTGGGGAGGSILLFANSGGLGGLTVSAVGGNAGNAWPETAPGAFPGARHGPGGGGSGGVIFLSATPTSMNVSGGLNGSTDTVQDSFGATPGSAGVTAVTHIITETPGTQPGAYCASADLSVTNSGTPSVVTPGSNITYTQTVTNNSTTNAAVNAVFSEAVPANTTFQSISVPTGWTCTTPAVGATGNISCTNSLFAASGTGTFTVAVQVNAGTTNQTQITDTDSISSGTPDPNLANNSASVTTVVGVTGTADLVVTNTGTPNPVLAGNNITYTQVVSNNGPAAAASVTFTELVPANTSFQSMPTPTGWSCTTPVANATSGTITCTITSLASGSSSTFQPIFKVIAGTASGTVITDTDSALATTPDPNPTNNSATSSVTVASTGQSDLAVTASGSPNPVLAGNNVTFTEKLTNNGPTAVSSTLTSAASFTQSLPTNGAASFVSMTAPAGFTCTTPAVGATSGTISCTQNLLSTLASGSSVTFTLVLKALSTDANGTAIAVTPTASTTNGDPVSSNNSATATVYVASPSQADVAIVKTASPEPVDQGTNLVYTLQVTNNGPAVAQGVTVTDVLPSAVTYSSSSTTQGTCTYTSATTTVSCSLGNLTVGQLVIVTINVSASTLTSNGSLTSNTATVSATTSDPNSTNNSSTATSTIQSPTAVQLISFNAFIRPDGTTLLEWKTREEVRNLGFNVYREDATGRHRLNPSLIAGSALVLRGTLPQHAAKTYQWLDTNSSGVNATYWIEDVDLSGAKTSHGPAQLAGIPLSSPVSAAKLLTRVSADLRKGAVRTVTPEIERDSANFRTQLPALAVSNDYLNREPAVKISVRAEGWYHVTRAQLVAAGLDPMADARTLQLYAEGVEQPIRIIGNQAGALGPNDAIEFYGTGIDTPYSDTRVYWLTFNRGYGKRIPLVQVSDSGSTPAESFPATVVREDRTTYFAALLNSEDQDNFFGAIVTSDPTDQDLTVTNIVPNHSAATLDVVLQGVTEDQNHRVTVSLNGAALGTMEFSGQANYKQSFPVDASVLQSGTNTITLTALEGDNDISLVQTIALHYEHALVADGDELRMQAPAGSLLHISGFSVPQIRLFDITNPLAVEELAVKVETNGSSGYSVETAVPNTLRSQPHTLLALTNAQISAPDSLAFRAANALDMRQHGGDIVIITHPDFVDSLAPLVKLRQQQGHTVDVVTVDAIFDAFNYGERSPYAIRSFLHSAQRNWRVRPSALLLVGDASFDPRNYLGFGDFDFVPTRLIDTAAFKTASDDWFSDFQQTGFVTIATGRLPVRTAQEANLVVSKILSYEQGGGAWSSQALVIADQNLGADFTSAANAAAALLPKSVSVNRIQMSNDPAITKQQILAAINNGQGLVNYSGHGSVEQWSFVDLLDDSDAAALSNGNRLPVFLVMDCLNGFFQDVYTQSLAESLLLAPNGGAVSVWASSGFTEAPPQAAMNQALLQILASNPKISLGAAILQAKRSVTDRDVRRTWILFGDPSLHVKFSSSTGSSKP